MSTETTSRKPVVAFLGPVASYSHQATLQGFPPEQYELVPVVTIKDVFDATQSGQADYGVVPVENSTNGSVVFTLDNFADRSSVYPDLSVSAEIYQDVHHCLLGNSSSLPPPFPQPSSSSSTTTTTTTAIINPDSPRTRTSHPFYDLSRIQRIYSHPQVWGQVTRFLNTHLRGIETIDVSSTSRAAELVRDDTTGTSAAISSAVAAQLTQTTVLAENIEDREDNTTRFFVLSKADKRMDDNDDDNNGVDVSKAAATTTTRTKTTISEVPTKSLLSFTVPHRHPGALADVLACFRGSGSGSKGLNLTSINSRPSQVEPFQYIFFVELEGHKFRDPEGKVRDVLDKIDKVAERWRWLGSWVAKR